MLRRKHSSNRDGLDSAEQEARHRQWKDLVQITRMQRRQPDMRKTTWQVAEHFDAPLAETERSSGEDAADHHEQCHRFVFQEPLAKHEDEQRAKSDGQRWRVGLTEMREEVGQ